MTDAEQRIEKIEAHADLSDADNQMAQVLALCEIARQLARLGDLYEVQIDKPHLAHITIRARKPKAQTDEPRALDTDGATT